jgi:hypothetical protein
MAVLPEELDLPQILEALVRFMAAVEVAVDTKFLLSTPVALVAMLGRVAGELAQMQDDLHLEQYLLLQAPRTEVAAAVDLAAAPPELREDQE